MTTKSILRFKFCQQGVLMLNFSVFMYIILSRNVMLEISNHKLNDTPPPSLPPPPPQSLRKKLLLNWRMHNVDPYPCKLKLLLSFISTCTGTIRPLRDSWRSTHWNKGLKTLYTYQGDCTYQLVSDSTNNFFVYGDFFKCLHTKSCLYAIIINYEGHIVKLERVGRIYVDNILIPINALTYETPDGHIRIEKDGGWIRVELSNGVYILWDKKKKAKTHLPITFQGVTMGKLGHSRLTNLCLVDSSILANWTSPLFIKGMSGVLFTFILVLVENSFIIYEKRDPDQPPRSAASDLGLHCLLLTF